MTTLHIYYLRVPPKVLASKFPIYYDKVFNGALHVLLAHRVAVNMSATTCR
jgi:hypothetical protein